MKNLLVFLSLVLSITLQAAKIPPFVFERSGSAEKNQLAVLSLWYSYESEKTQVKFEAERSNPRSTRFSNSQTKSLFADPVCTYTMDAGGALNKIECSETSGLIVTKLVVLKKPGGFFAATEFKYDTKGVLTSEEVLDDKLQLKSKPELVGMWDFTDQPLSNNANTQSQIKLVRDYYTSDFNLTQINYLPRIQSFNLATGLKCHSTLTKSPKRQAFESIECAGTASDKAVEVKITQQSNVYYRVIYSETVEGVQTSNNLGSKYILRGFGRR